MKTNQFIFFQFHSHKNDFNLNFFLNKIRVSKTQLCRREKLDANKAIKSSKKVKLKLMKI